MKILYINHVAKQNIVGYFKNLQVILDSLAITYSSQEELVVQADGGLITVYSAGEVVEVYYAFEGFICDVAEHL